MYLRLLSRINMITDADYKRRKEPFKISLGNVFRVFTDI